MLNYILLWIIFTLLLCFALYGHNNILKNITIWIVNMLLISFLLFKITSLISNTKFLNIFSEFEIILILIGFSSTISTIITCTKIILDNIKK